MCAMSASASSWPFLQSFTRDGFVNACIKELIFFPFLRLGWFYHNMWLHCLLTQWGDSIALLSDSIQLHISISGKNDIQTWFWALSSKNFAWPSARYLFLNKIVEKFLKFFTCTKCMRFACILIWIWICNFWMECGSMNLDVDPNQWYIYCKLLVTVSRIIPAIIT